ncbi:MAG: S9 family peptidase [Pseudomonadota bacterium]
MFRKADPPRARRGDKTLHRHGHRRRDPYFWMADRNDVDVIEHLTRENQYTDAVMAGTAALQRELYDEIRGRMVDERVSPPVFERGFWYWHRYAAGAEYATFWRSREPDTAGGELLLDGPTLAEGHEFFAIGDIDISTDERWLAYTVDTTGRRRYRLFLRDLEHHRVVDTGIDDIGSDVAWANDNASLFVVAKDRETLREFRLDRLDVQEGMVRGRDPVYEELDTTYYLDVARTSRRDFVVVTANATLTTEHWLIDAAKPNAAPRVFLPRQPGHEYALDFDGSYFWLLSNLDAPNGKLARTTADHHGPEHWETVIAESAATQLEDFELFDGHVAVEVSRDAQAGIELIDSTSFARQSIEFDEAVYAVTLDDNPSYEAGAVRLRYESMARPDSIIDVDRKTLAQTVVYTEQIGGNFDTDNYVVERHWVRRDDGVRVPVSLVRRADSQLDAALDVLVYGYGAYGYSLAPTFSLSRLSLVDRGFVVAIAHVRGGAEFGEAWYNAGRLKRKHASFDDFVAVAETFRGYGGGAPNALYAMGGSAGGLLVGAAMNLRPDLFRAVIAEVPFVDVVTTMLDDSIPLTTFEYEEWGDPRRSDDYFTMLSYSPYDNVARAKYPHVLITTGLHDSQVQYWEPAKWAARLRERNRADTVVLLQTEMDAGHGGRSGRYRQLHERCFVYAFLLAATALDGDRP